MTTQQFKLLILLVCLCSFSLLADNNDIIIADFEGGVYPEGWTASGTAFGYGPAKGAIGGQKKVSGFEGMGLVNTYNPSDKATGTLTGQEFTIKRNFITFLIGGGNHKNETCINLLVNGKVVRTQTGPDDEQLKFAYWDVSDLVDKKAVIQIVDAHKGGWGHVSIDSIVQTDKQPWVDIEVKIKAEKKYLNIPVDNDLNIERAYVYVEGKMDTYLSLQLADPGEADFWVYMDISRYDGKEITLKTKREQSNDPRAFEQCYQSDEPREAATFYKEKNRPQFHYSSKRGRLSDANGLVYYNGEYNLFYQHQPYGWVSSTPGIHWGHAVSTDLVHWTEIGDALFPDSLGSIYSGSAVVDKNNTAGLKDGKESPIVAVYTSAGDWAPIKKLRTQSISYSTDGGRTFTKYSDNPVVSHIEGLNRDPKVLWHEQTGKWIMALYLNGGDYCLLSSPDLKQWEKICDVNLEDVRECPDFFPLALDGDKDNIKWIFWGGNGTYVTGSFDGTIFIPETEPKQCYDGGNAYAGQTFNDIPASDGRIIHIPWLRDGKGIGFIGMPFNQQMGFPVEFKLKTVNNTPMLFAWPIKEISSIYSKTRKVSNRRLSQQNNAIDEIRDGNLDIYAEFQIVDNSAVFGFEVRGEKFVYNCASKQIEARGKKINLEPVNGKINMRILIDVLSVEFFAGDGLVYYPGYLLKSQTDGKVKIFSDTGAVVIKQLEVNELDSIWN